jgi:hypothetical protein
VNETGIRGIIAASVALSVSRTEMERRAFQYRKCPHSLKRRTPKAK